MEKLEKIQNYINNTKAISPRYDIMCPEIEELVILSRKEPVDAISLSFNYGRAKGYRAAKKEARI